MRNYEVTFIVDPVLSGDEIKAAAQTYVDHLEKGGCKIVHVNELGLRQLAYPINKRTSGIYYCIEFEMEGGDLIAGLELAFRRDERIMRFLTVSLDKYGVKYNDDKRNGLIGTVKKKEKKEDKDDRRRGRGGSSRGGQKSAPKEKPAPVKKEKEPVAAAPAEKPAPAKKETEAAPAEKTAPAKKEPVAAPVAENPTPDPKPEAKKEEEE